LSEPLESEVYEAEAYEVTTVTVAEAEMLVVAAPVVGRVKVDPLYSHDGVFTVVGNLLETIVVVLFLATFVVQPSRIPSESMLPTLKVGDFVLVDKQAFVPAGVLDRWLLPSETIQRHDMVVFHYPVNGDETLVKRVIGMPGDHIHLHQGRVYVDGGLLFEPYAIYKPAAKNSYRDEFPSLSDYPDDNVQTKWWLDLRRIPAGEDLVVPAGHYFVLGDNRNDSEDSRYWGFVPQDAVIGRPLLVYFSARAREAAGVWGHLRAEWRAVHVPE
jgi:signal peptidase I